MTPRRHGTLLRNTPNLLTFLRICLAPFLIVAVVEHHFALAFGLFLVAACTDAMDGLLARWLRQRTMLGLYLDPAADKLLLSSLFLVLTLMHLLDPRVTVIVFGRDLGMSLTALLVYWTAGVRDFRPTLLGKANSVSQVVAIAFVLWSLSTAQPWVANARHIALILTVTLTVLSGFHYGWIVSERIGAAVEAQAAQRVDASQKHS